MYKAVEAVSDFAIELGINVPTGKDSLSMKQKYEDEEVIAPGTVIISAAGECSDINKVVEPVFQNISGNQIYYIDLSQDDFKLGGSSFAQIRNNIGAQTPTVTNAQYFKKGFNGIQKLIENDLLLAGHDISAGGMLTTLLEMCFASPDLGARINLANLNESDRVKVLFAENAGVIIQTDRPDKVEELLNDNKIKYHAIGKAVGTATLEITNYNLSFDIEQYRDYWFKTSYLLDKEQTAGDLARQRFENY